MTILAMKKEIKSLTETFISRSVIKSHLPLLIVLLFFSGLDMAEAYEPKVGRVTASTGPFMFRGDFRSSQSDSYFPREKLGFAFIAEAVFAKNSALEIGLFYLKKPYFREKNGNYLVQDIQRIYITTGYRYWWSEYFSTSAGLFSSFSTGDPRELDQSAGLPDDFATTAEEITNYGVDISARIEFDFSKKDGIFLDFRYALNLTALHEGENGNHIAVGLFYMREIDVD